MWCIMNLSETVISPRIVLKPKDARPTNKSYSTKTRLLLGYPTNQPKKKNQKKTVVFIQDTSEFTSLRKQPIMCNVQLTADYTNFVLYEQYILINDPHRQLRFIIFFKNLI